MAYPLGINFGPTYITAAHAADATSVVPVVRVEGSETYRTFFLQVLENNVMNCIEGQPVEEKSLARFPNDRDSFRAGAILTDALSSIKAAAERALGEAIDIRAMSLPYCWNGTISNTMFDVANASGFTIKGSRQILKFPRAARVAYNLDTFRDDHVIILVDYNAAYLYLSIVEVSGDACIAEGQVQLAELGENVLKVDLSFTSLRDSEIENPTGEPNMTSSEHDHYNRIQEALTKFVAECTVEDSTQIPQKPPWKFLYSDIRAVILSGEASDRGLNYIRTILSRTFSRSGKEVLQDSIDPLYVGALGAAKCARAQVENPSMFETHTDVPEYIPETP